MKTKKEKLEYYKKYIKLHPIKKKRYDKKYKVTHKKEVRERLKKYYKKNRKKLLKQMKLYRELHKIKMKRYQKLYQENHKEKNKEYQQIYRKKYKEQLRIKDCKYKKLNREHYNKYWNNKRKNNIHFKVKWYISNRIRSALKGNPKLSTTMKLVGCSIDKLKKHLESKFQLGMFWNNYGKWHIDHIRPCASFDLSKPEEQRKCFHYINLQPLWAKDNMKKNDKYE